MNDIAFHYGKPEDSALLVSVDGDMATPKQIDKLLKILNYDVGVNAAIAMLFSEEQP